jgi:hypothetical protein
MNAACEPPTSGGLHARGDETRSHAGHTHRAHRAAGVYTVEHSWEVLYFLGVEGSDEA